MPRTHVVFEQVEHGETGMVGEQNVKNDGVWQVLPGDLDSLISGLGDEALEAEFMGQVAEDERESRVVFNDQDDAAVASQTPAVILDLSGLDGRRRGVSPLARRRRGGDRRQGRLSRDRRSVAHNARLPQRAESRVIDLRNGHGENAATSHLAPYSYFAAEQPRQFTRNGKAEARASVFPVCRAVSLAKRFKDDLLLFLGDADAGVADG